MATGLIWLGLGRFSLTPLLGIEKYQAIHFNTPVLVMRPLRIRNRKQSYCTGLGICKGSHSSLHDVKVFLGFLLLGSESENG